LLRLYDVSGGEVLINGRNIKDYDIHKLRLHIGVAFQDVRVLAMSLRDNLTVYHDMPDEGLAEVIHKLGLESVLEKAGGNLDTMVSREFTEDGVALSGGEAQRLTLARLFTGAFGLLVLDEPSSALDPLAEYKLMQIILDASNTATTLMIAHRLSTVREFDRIYHMEEGAIIESGTHEELMSAQGKYWEMFTRQAENYQSGE
jgi:ATP-binding cassette subfamily B protein